MNGLILVAGGKGQRFSGGKGKAQLRVFKGWSLLDYWQVRLETLKDLFQDVVVVTDSPMDLENIKVALPGSSRKESVANGFEKTGHIMKLRYTPLQFAVLSADEQQSPYHKVFDDFESLKGMPVIIGELHSMLAPIVFNIKQNRPELRVSYIMTDGGALPLSFSRTVAYLREKELIQGTVTFGQAFGGDFETVNIYTALITAYEILKSDIAIVTMGPGITGTGTKYGFSGIEQGPIIDAVNTLGGRPIFIPRISFADSRKRHCGISHHSVTVLKEIAKTRAEVVIPLMEVDKMDLIKKLIVKNELDKNHKIVYIEERDKILESLLHLLRTRSTI